MIAQKTRMLQINLAKINAEALLSNTNIEFRKGNTVDLFSWIQKKQNNNFISKDKKKEKYIKHF